MSFDVYLSRFERGEPAEADRDAIAIVFQGLGATGPDDFGRYEVPVVDLWEMVSEGADDTVIEVTIFGRQDAGDGHGLQPYRITIDASGLDGQEEFQGCAFFLHAFSPGIAQIIFRVAAAGSLTIVPVSEAGAVLPPSVDAADLPDDDYFAEPCRVASGDDLFAALRPGYERYEHWRDQVIPRTPPRPRLRRWGRQGKRA